ncbi:MAG: CoA pyrophosphatase [Bacteroidales bacterium]|nr:CoA pyrophosphatase [Bacteroidales bacterium]
MLDFAERIKKQLENDLPGSEAQKQMLPSHRPEIFNINTYHKAGVLLYIFQQKNELFSVLIKRTDDDGPHSGQISLPGGKYELSDKNTIETALREAKEEIGINISDLMVLGQLTNVPIPVSRFIVTPVVAFSSNKPEFTIDPQEVKEVIIFKLNDLLLSDIRKSEEIIINNIQRKIPYFNIQNHHVWGATAMVLSEFSEILSKIQ